MSTETEPLSISFATPGDWVEVDVTRLADRATFTELVDGRLEQVPPLAPYREQLIDVFTKTAARAEHSGVLYNAVLADLTTSEQPLIATLSVAAAPADPPSETEGLPDGGDRPPPTVDDLEAALADREPDVQQREVNSMLLPGGPALRIARITELPIIGEGDDQLTMTILSVQYYFAAPGHREFVVLHFTSPTIGAHLRLQAIFHDIADGFRFKGGPESGFPQSNGDGAAPPA